VAVATTVVVTTSATSSSATSTIKKGTHQLRLVGVFWF
jgi:hypothetical protein